MSESYERKKNLYYIANAFSDFNYVNNNLKEICEWIFGKGSIYVKYKWFENEEEDNEDKFYNYAQKNKNEAFKKIKDFAKKLQKLADETPYQNLSVLEKNLFFLQKIFKLKKYEKEFLGYIIREKSSNIFRKTFAEMHWRDFSADDRALFLNIDINKIHNLSHYNSFLYQIGFLEKEYDGNIDVTGLAKSFNFQKFDNENELKDYLLGTPVKANLSWEDFSHIEQAETVAKILNAAIKKKEKGINILLYGEPGTGKTEFVKTLAEKLKISLYSIGENDNKWAEDDNLNRKTQLIRAQIILKKEKNSIFLIDEADDILSECRSFLFSKRDYEKNTKLAINRLLENNSLPTIWILNSIWDIDKAYLRRFTYAINFTRPKKEIIEQMWLKSLRKNNISEDKNIAKEFAKKYSLSPSFIDTATKSVKLIKGDIKDIEHVLDNLQQAYNNGRKTKEEANNISNDFNPLLLNTDTNLIKLRDRVVSLNKLNFSLCLYGASGTGKSAFAQYLADELHIPTIKKKCSDLMSMFVGETEKCISQAFEEAKDRGAMLIFDEADSFLRDRTTAVRNWEITQVNEMLTQMEKHTYPFVCTTNLMNKIDQASLRRFTFKIKYNYMTDEQKTLCFEHFFGIKNISLNHILSLTPGDFVVVKNKAEILDCLNDKTELIKMLEQEQINKAPVHKKIGFI